MISPGNSFLPFRSNYTLLGCAGGFKKMVLISASSRQPPRVSWMLDCLNYEQPILLGISIDSTTAATYSSATNSYLTFCKKHQLSIELTAETLSYYTTYQTHFISPNSVNSYLLGIINQLKPYYLEVHKHWGSLLVKWTLKGAWRMWSKGVYWKKPLSVQDLESMWVCLEGSSSFDDLLFKAQLNTRFSGLFHLGELVKNDKPALWDWKKITMRHSLKWLPNAHTFSLPHHKGDLVFEGNHIICRRITGAPEPLSIMCRYIDVHDHLYPLHPQLWLQSNSLTPVCAWWISQFQWFFPDSNLVGQSMWAGGATALAEAGAVPDLIMGSGQWTSYVWKNPVLLHALILTWATHFQPLTFAWTFILSSTYVSPVLFHLHSSHFFFLYFPTYTKKKPSLLSLFTVLPWFAWFH